MPNELPKPVSDQDHYDVEKIRLLNQIAGGEETTGEALPTPNSRQDHYDEEIIRLLGQIAKGGGGTSDYSDLENKPQINGVTLNGNKTTNQLDILPTANWNATVSVAFAAQSTTAEINGNSFTKVSDMAFTASQLDGAVFAMQGDTVLIEASDLTDMSAIGVTGTLIDIPGIGNVVFSCTEAGNVVSEPGFYLVTAMISYAPYVTMSYTDALTASTRAIGIGEMQMEDGVTDLPTGVVWLQIES